MGPIELRLHTLLTAMGWLNCGEPHQIFAGGLRYVPPSSTGTIDREAYEELSELGLTRGNGVTDELEDVLRIVDRPHTEYFAHVRTGDDQQYGVLVAVHGRSAVAASCQDGHVRLRSISDSDRPAALVAHLPEFPPARFVPFSVPRAEYTGQNPTSYVSRHGQDSARLHELFDQPNFGLGQLYVARRPNGGQRVRAERVVSYIDIDAGRVGFELVGPLDSEYITVHPGDGATLAGKLTELRRSIDRRRD